MRSLVVSRSTYEESGIRTERNELKVEEEDKERIVDNAVSFFINLPIVWH